MPRLPGPEDVPEIGLRNTRDVITPPRSAVLDEAVRTVDRVGELVGRIADQQNEVALNRADVETAVELDTIRERYRTDDDWETAPERAREEADAALKARGATLRGAAAQRAWEMRSAERLGRFHLDMRGQSRERGAAMARADLLKLGEASEAAAGDLANSEAVRQTAVQAYAAAIDSALERGMLDPDDAARLESAFAANVRSRVQDGLRAEVTERIALDPGELADELEDPESDFRTLDADERARLVRQARAGAASMAIDDALEHTLRTGEIVGETHPRLAGGWVALGDGARLQYAERASRMLAANRFARQTGDLAGLSLADIAARADQAQDASEEAAARAVLRTVARDPASYMLAQPNNIEPLRARAAQAAAASRAAPDNSEAQMAATQARGAYAQATVAAQAALGVPSGDIRINTQASLQDWARRIHALPPDRQQAVLDRLGEQMLSMYGDEDLAQRAIEEHLSAYYGGAGQASAGHEPAQRAASGADGENVRGLIERAITAGHDPGGPVVQSYLSRLPPAERARVEEALGANPQN